MAYRARRMASRTRALALAAVLIVAGGTCVAASGPVGAQAAGPTALKIGIADEKQVFSDTRLRALGLGYARRSVAWDALGSKRQARELDAWIGGARAAGMAPLITFARSRTGSGRHRPPTAARFERAFLRFRKRYPDVRTYSSWNEANHCGTGTCDRPELVARYYSAIRRNCHGCTVLAADLNDHPDPVPWARRFRRALGSEPPIWGYHNYIDANRMQTTLTARLLRAVKGQLWLSEVGGIVARRNGSPVAMPQGKAHAALVTRFIFDRLARISPRITRVYVYHWSSGTSQDSWDSAFIASDGRPRPSLPVFERILRENRVPRG